jgi:homoaconitase/3-isopropylmalate dehydratase large subunit
MKIILLTLLCASALVFTSCGNSTKSAESSVPVAGVGTADKSGIVNTGKSADEAYDMLHVVFEGNPEKEVIRKLMSAVMAKYNIEENYENLNRCGSALLGLKQSSAIAITEMQILKHMYQHGDSGYNFPTQAAISAVFLEQSN